MSTLENERSGKGVTMGIPAVVPKEGGEGKQKGEPSLLSSEEEETTSRKRK
jgi:hypothetical protein